MLRSVFVALSVVGSLAHNWIESPSRVPFAATFFPCLPPRNNFPHVQVSQNQEFQIEWSTGHDRDVYFVLIHRNDSDWLDQNDEQALDDYIARAPAGSVKYSQRYQKYHRTTKQGTDTHALGGTVASHYRRKVPTSDPYFIPRPAAFGDPMDLYEYNSGDMTSDTWVSYVSSRYPWIKSVWRYTISQADPGEWDTAQFKIPPEYTLAGGNFVVQYLWSGYYDCVDINVLPQVNPTVYPYGKKINGTDGIVVSRIDHCVFDAPVQFMTFPRLVMGDAMYAGSLCTDACRDAWEDGCGGVSVFPYKFWEKPLGPHWNTNNNFLKQYYEQAWNATWDSNPPFNMDIGLPYEDSMNGVWLWRNFAPNSQNTGFDYIGANMTTLNAVRQTTEAFPNAWVCVMVQPRYATTTRDKFTTTDDPDDPVWYSTCYEVNEIKQFIGFDVNVTFNADIPTDYLVGRCISCGDAKLWSNEHYAPKWTLDTCKYCERDFPNVVPVAPHFSRVQQGAYEGTDSMNANCVAPANAAGFTGPDAGSDFCIIYHNQYHPLLESNGDLSIYWSFPSFFRRPEQCAAYMAQQAECSQWVFHGPQGWQGCRCVRNHACCLANFRADDASGWYEGALYDSRPSTPDPTCSGPKSLKSADNQACCYQGTTNGCSTVGGCTTTTWPRPDGNMCRKDLIAPERKCSQYGPPCMLV